MLKLINITKDYKTAGSEVQALKGVSLEFRKNEFVSILGASGCGKTTLLNIIGGLDHYTTGDLIIRGVSTKDYSDRDWDVYRNHRIGFVFQSYNLIPHQTVLENVEIALTISGISKTERKKKAEQALIKVGLQKELNKRPNQLSGGQMQRVAIARALVNDPEILLADEPTGALDTKTSVQIMDLIREIAGERLVIMVTHNPELAEQYSSRIVRLSDGLVVADSNPYDGTETTENQCKEETADKETIECKSKEKASMSFTTSLGLSARNLRTKKGRTILTSFAGSIGIVSVCLVLALSSGFNSYIKTTEENMLARYPVQITESSIDITSIMTGMNTRAADVPDLSKLEDKVYLDSYITKIANGMTVTNKMSAEYMDYLSEMDDGICEAVQYSYGESFADNLFTDVKVGETEESLTTQIRSLTSLKKFYTDELTSKASEYQKLAGMVDYLGAAVSKMPGTSDFTDENYGKYVLSQYDVITGTFPQNEGEAVLIVSKDNTEIDLLMAQLGFIEETRFMRYFDLGEQGENESSIDESKLISFDDILNKQFTLYYNDEVYEENASFGTGTNPTVPYPFTYKNDGVRSDLEVRNDENGNPNGIKIKISGILRVKDDLEYGCLRTGLSLTEKTVEDYIQRNAESKIGKWIRDKSHIRNFINTLRFLELPKELQDRLLAGTMAFYRSPAENLNKYSVSGSEFNGLLDGYTVNYLLGMPDGMPIYLTTSLTQVERAISSAHEVTTINFYPSNFEAKEKLLTYLDAWNETHTTEEKVTYTDSIGMIMGMVQSILDAVTYVLVAFTAISLIVSSVMIGIITFVSVVERTKEIGVLRSLGARKRDIRNLFNAETFLIGLFAGLIGVGATYLLSIPINVIMQNLADIPSIASLPIEQGVIMIVVSISLTLISGLIPAQSAAKKDPVIALRTE